MVAPFRDRTTDGDVKIADHVDHAPDMIRQAVAVNIDPCQRIDVQAARERFDNRGNVVTVPRVGESVNDGRFVRHQACLQARSKFRARR
jgi:hypothetical protein